MTDKIFVIHTDGSKEPFKPRIISQTIMDETGVKQDLADRIQDRIAKKIYKLKQNEGLMEISTSDLRAEVSSHLLREGEFDAVEQNRKLGMSVSEFEDLLQNGCKDNANIGYTPEMVAKYAYDSIAKEYSLLKMPEHCSKAHIDGYIHIHDLEYLEVRPNCMNYDLRFFAKNGLKIDGHGLMGSVAKPAKSLEVLLNHLLQAFMAGATVFSGGQGYANFNSLLSVFARGRTYEEIKQAIQGFIFNCNMSLICRGGQVLFSSIGIDMSIPEVLKNEPAIGPGGVVSGVYGDYQEEADLIFRAILEVSNERDGMGAYHRFPNILINIREGDLDEYSGNCKLVHEIGANNPTLYYVNCTGLERTVMGCFSPDTSLWVKIDNQLRYLSFKEIDKLLNADIGKTKVDNIEVLTVDDDKNIIWHKAKNFIKNEPQELYKIKLAGNKTFVCDKNHSMITNRAMNKQNILDCKSNLLDVACILNDEQSHLIPDKRAMLYGFYLGDGKKVGFDKGYANFMLLKEDKINYVRNLLDDLNIEYKEDIVYHSRDDANYTVFYFDSDEIQKPDLTDINCLAGLLSGLLSSDGYVRINGGFNNSLGVEFVSTDMEYTQLFKWACFNLGIKFSSRIIQPSKNQKNRQPFERVYLSCNYESVRALQQLTLRDEQHQIVQSVDNDYRHITETKSQSVKEIIPLHETDYTYCFEVNDRIIVSDDFILTGNCRTALPMNWTGSYNVDCLNTGNFAYTTLNLPLIALDSNGDVDEFYQKLDEVCEIAYDGLIYRRNRVIDTIYNKHMSDFLLQEDRDTGKPLYDIDNTTITLGFCGLHECLKTLNNISDNEGEKIIKFLNSKKEEFHERDNLRWSVIASPAESTAHRFAEIIKEKYPDAIVQGVKGSYYLTNSNHIPVSDDSNIIAHIKNAQQYNKLTLGGSILHLWLGEVWSDDKAIWSLNKKIVDSDVTFWAYSKVFTYCQECQFTINDNIDVCPICGSSDLVTYDRCFAGDTFIYIKKDKIVKPVTLKDFVENYHVTDWQVPVFDYKTQSYIWSKVKRGIKNPPEPMINICFNKGYEVTCTPNHNFYDYKTYKRKHSMYDTISANDLGIKSRVINHRCPMFLNNIEEDYLGTFIGFVLGDGNVTLQKNGKNVFIRLKFYKKEKSDYCKEILDRNNLEYTFSDAGIDERYNSQTYSYYIGANNIGNKAYDMFNMTRGNKKAIIDMCYNQDLFVGIFAGLINSDGSILVESRKNSIVTTFNQVDRDILWLFYNIALLLGTNPSISFTERDEYDSVGRIEITSSRAYDILNNIILRSPFDEALIKGKCISDAKSVNGMCSVSSISESIVQNSYCIETEHDGHNTLFNGVLAENCTGYYLPTLGFNNGKQQEFKDRYRHKL